MLRPLKMPADKELQTLPGSVRKEQHSQDHHAKEDNEGCDRKTGDASKAGNDLSQYSDNKKIRPG